MGTNFIGHGVSGIDEIELAWECPSCNKVYYEYYEPSKELIDAIENGNLVPISCPYCRQSVKEEDL